MRRMRGEAARARRSERSALFASADGSAGGLLDSVRRGLLLVILIAITPIATASMLQGVLQLQRATEEAQHRLLQGAIAGAGSQQNVFSSAENVLQALKNVQDVVSAGTDCGPTLYGAVLSLPFASNIALVNASGMIICSALATSSPDVSRREWWIEARATKAFTLSRRVMSPVTRSEVINGTLPLVDANGDFDGALIIAIDAGWMDNLLKRETPLSDGIAAVLDSSGRELVSNAPDISRKLFDDRDMVKYLGGLGTTEDDTNRSWSFAAASLDRHQLFVAFAKPSSQLFEWTTLHVVVSFILPICMVIFTIVAIWLATDRMVLRWLLYLRRVTVVYAEGHYGFRPSRMNQAPSEFRVLGGAIEDMALAIRDRDAKLREALAEKTAMVREIHHRIKNSLQVVVSLMSLYGSGVPEGRDRRRFEQLRTRVNTLAVVHRILYEANDGSEVRSRELLRELGSLLEGAMDHNVLILVEADDVALPTDLAVPLALLMTEIVMHLGENRGILAPGPQALRLVIDCMQEADQVMLGIEVNAPIGDLMNETKIPLAHGFASQLGGTVSSLDGVQGARIDVRFPPRPGAR